MSNIVKSKFAGLLRGLLRRFDDSDAAAAAPPRPMAASTAPDAAASQSKPQAVSAPPPATPAAGPGSLQLPLPSVIAVLPMDLRARLMQTPPADAVFSIPVEKVLSQLASGSVKISFGELRADAPGLFTSYGADNDSRQIALPLNEIISRISPALLSRRSAKKVAPADDIAGPFGAQAKGIDLTPAPARTAPAPASAPIPFSPAPAADFNAAPKIPVENTILAPLSVLAEKWPDAIKMELVQTGLMSAQAALPAALVEAGLKRGRVTMLWKNLRMMIRPKPAPVSIHDGVEVELPLKVLAPLVISGQKPAGQTRQKVSVSDEIPDLFHSFKQAEAAATPAPASAPAPVAEIAPVAPTVATPAAPVPTAPARPVFSAQQVAPAKPAAPGRETISAPLEALSEKWPETLRQEIAQWNLVNAQVALPLNALTPAMKLGRVTFVWRELRAWIRPAPTATTSAHDNAKLELPLKVIAPLFLERQTPPAKPQPRLTIDSSIPSPFSKVASAKTEAPVAAPAAEPVPEPVRPALKPVDAKLSETKFYVWGDSSDTPRVDESEYKRPPSPAADSPVRYATPKEIVVRAMALPGVTGAVVALYDGLMIVGQVPPDLDADTIAAFLPQIVGRTGQSAKELGMGELNNLSFTAGNVPWNIFRVNALYFAAFGRAGGSLPTAQLAALAGQLDRGKQ
jgi:predicted regulator of Ras-like GTPase activity (Roadblock/LC7/MglB family)